MSEFFNVVNEFSRMCKLYDSYCDTKECPIAALIKEWEDIHEEEWESPCLEFARENPEEFEDVVMTWAKEHPTPIYPTIGEVIKKLCVLMNINPRTCGNTIYDERLTEEAANYFNIKPIN